MAASLEEEGEKEGDGDGDGGNTGMKFLKVVRILVRGFNSFKMTPSSSLTHAKGILKFPRF